MRLWITTDPYPDVTPETAAAAEQAGAAIIVHGVPQRLAGIVADDAVGLVEVPDEPEPVDLADVPDLEADLLDRAEQARRTAYDAVMSAGPRSMARLEDADRAGSEAFRAVLRGEA